MALDTTTTSATPRLSARWPCLMVQPMLTRWRVMSVSFTSEPDTVYPMLASTSASPHTPMPPMPTKWIFVSCLRNMSALPALGLVLAPVDDGASGSQPGEPLHSRSHVLAESRIVQQ